MEIVNQNNPVANVGCISKPSLARNQGLAPYSVLEKPHARLGK